MESLLKKIHIKDKIFYLCTTHKTLNEQENCTYLEKREFLEEKVYKISEVKSLEFVFTEPFSSKTSAILLNGSEILSAFLLENSRLIKDDFYELYQSLKNKKVLERVICPFCNQAHNDNGVFAIKPHQKHLCLYCGKIFLYLTKI